MTKKNLTAEVTVKVLGKELTKAEALELHAELTKALGIQPTIQFVYRDRSVYPYQPLQPYWNLIGSGMSLAGGTGDPYRVDSGGTCLAEKLVN